ncbi:MAG: polysaccharide deacetylase family protein [Melioribacteraceae bacterium]
MKKLIILIALLVSNINAQKYVALTFDDAPDSFYTEKILDILKEENVKATFFVLGEKVKKDPEIIKRINDEGHLIGNHSTSHINFLEDYKDSISVINDVSYVDSILCSTICKKTHYFRPPYGALRDDQKQLLQNYGYEIAMWTVSTKDWDVFNITKENIIDSVKKNIHNNAIILMHSKNCSEDKSKYPYRDNTLEALPEVIKYLKENNYQMVTFDKIKTKCGIGGDANSLEENLVSRDDIIFYGGFDEGFNDDYWKKNWGIKWNHRADENEIIDKAFQCGKSLRVNYPKGGLGPSTTGQQFPIVFRDIPNMKDDYFQEVYLRYYVKFEKGFDFRKGGKLPGLMGGGDSWKRSGGNQPVGNNGWTLRFMWVEDGKLIVYAYVPKSKNGKWGEALWGQGIDCDFTAAPGKWICIEQYVNVGTPNKDDGKLKVWIDGIEKVNIDDMRFWNVENNDGRIGGIYFSTFHGGNTDDWRPLNDSFAQFDGFVVAKKRVGLVK